MLKRKIIASYPVTWYRFKTKRRHTRGYIQLVYHGKYFLSVRDDDQEAKLPMGILDLIFKELKNRGIIIHIIGTQKTKLLMDFDKGLDNYFNLMRFKWEKSPSGRSEHYSDKYLRWAYKHCREKMTEGEQRELLWRLKNKRMKL